MQYKRIYVYVGILFVGVGRLLFSAALPTGSSYPITSLQSPAAPSGSTYPITPLTSPAAPLSPGSSADSVPDAASPRVWGKSSSPDRKPLFKRKDQPKTAQQLGQDLLNVMFDVEINKDEKPLQYLLSQKVYADADVTVLGIGDKNLLHYAARLGGFFGLQVLHLIIEYILHLPDGENILEKMINARDANGQTPAMVSLIMHKNEKGTADIIRLFGVYRTDFSVVDRAGKNLLDYAREYDDKEVIAVLQEMAEARAASLAGRRGNKRKPSSDEETKEVVSGRRKVA